MKNYTEREALKNWNELQVGDVINKTNAGRGDWNYEAKILRTDEPNFDGSVFSVEVALQGGVAEKMTFIKIEKETKHFGTLTSLKKRFH